MTQQQFGRRVDEIMSDGTVPMGAAIAQAADEDVHPAAVFTYRTDDGGRVIAVPAK